MDSMERHKNVKLPKKNGNSGKLSKTFSLLEEQGA